MAQMKHPLKVSMLRHSKRICSAVQSSPTYDWKEFDDVGTALVNVIHSDTSNYNDDDNNCKCNHTSSNSGMSTTEALERVAVWKNRSTRIAHAVESTAALAQIILRDNQQQRPIRIATTATTMIEMAPTTTITTTTELRHAYANVILRSVNGLADSLQQQRSAACSVAVLCAELGVPSWLVAIRHEATHNQLPPLPTLRMAAKALVQYFATVYWEPIRRRHEQHCENAWTLLCQYETAAMEMERARILSRKDDPPPQQQLDVNVSCKGDIGISEYDDDNDEEIIIEDGLLQSMPGTTSNRFAALMDDRAKIRKTTLTASSDPVPKKTAPAIQPRNVPMELHKKSHHPTPAICAKQFVTANIPIDILHDAAIQFLVERSMTDDSNIHSTTTTTTDIMTRDVLLIHRFRPLLAALGRSWPGFLCAFFIECVRQTISMDECCTGTDVTNGDHALPSTTLEVVVLSLRDGSVWESWIHLLLSKKFLSQFDVPTTATTTTTTTTMEPVRPSKYNKMTLANLETLRAFQYPLNRICDQLLLVLGPTCKDGSIRHNDQRSDSAVVQCRLVHLLMHVLGEDRLPNYGIELPVIVPQKNVHGPAPPAPPHTPLVSPPDHSTRRFDPSVSMTSNTTISLEAMEAYLSNHDAFPAAAAAAATSTTTTNVTPDPMIQATTTRTGDDDDDDDSTRDSITTTPPSNAVSPQWLQCESWEACAIGTLPLGMY